MALDTSRHFFHLHSTGRLRSAGLYTPSRMRIAWFLRHQHILRFAKDFMAPRSAAILWTRVNTSSFGHDRPTNMQPGRTPTIKAPSTRNAVLAVQERPIVGPPDASSSPLSRRYTTVAPSTEALGKVGPPDSSSATEAATVVANMPQQFLALHAQTSPVARISEPRQLPNPGADLAIKSENRASGVRTSPPGRDIGIRRPPTEMVRLFPFKSDSEAEIRTKPPPATKDSATGRSPVIDSQSRSNTASSAPIQNQQSSNVAVPSTIHIDGSALGRWAIQHLERTLAKPGNGMTGVDPRASIPRGRVSPF